MDASCLLLFFCHFDFYSDCPWSRTIPHQKCERKYHPCHHLRRYLPEDLALHICHIIHASQDLTVLHMQNWFLWTIQKEKQQGKQLDFQVEEWGKGYRNLESNYSNKSYKLPLVWFCSYLPPTTAQNVSIPITKPKYSSCKNLALWEQMGLFFTTFLFSSRAI